MGRFSTFLRRAGIGCGGFSLLLAITTAVWYENHYVLPPAPTRTLAEPNPNGYQTAIAACKLEVKERAGVVTSPYKRDLPQPLVGRKILLAANALSIGRLRDAFSQEWLAPEIRSLSQTSPEYAAFREEARMLAFAAGTYADSGNLPEAARCATDAIELGLKMPRGGVFITGLVGLACEAIGEAALWKLADRFDAKTARATIARLQELETKRIPLAEILRGEQAFNHTATSELVKDGPVEAYIWMNKVIRQEGDTEDIATSYILQPGIAGVWLRTKVIYTGPRGTLEHMNQWLELLATTSEKPWTGHMPVLPSTGDYVVELMAPVFTQHQFKWLQSRAQRQLLITYLALHAYRLEKGHDAPSLAALVQDGYLPRVPSDPFSPTRAPLRYAKGNLWSVGPDARDDGGKPIAMNGRKGYIQPEIKPGDLVARVNTW